MRKYETAVFSGRCLIVRNSVVNRHCTAFLSDFRLCRRKPCRIHVTVSTTRRKVREWEIEKSTDVLVPRRSSWDIIHETKNSFSNTLPHEVKFFKYRKQGPGRLETSYIRILLASIQAYVYSLVQYRHRADAHDVIFYAKRINSYMFITIHVMCRK